MSLLWILVIILVIGALLGSPGIGMWNHGYGYGPSGLIGVIVVILVVLLLLGRL